MRCDRPAAAALRANSCPALIIGVCSDSFCSDWTLSAPSFFELMDNVVQTGERNEVYHVRS